MEGEFESIAEKRARIRRGLRGIKTLSRDINQIAKKKPDFDFALGTVLLKILDGVYAVLKKYATLAHHEPFDVYKFWAPEKAWTPNVIELRRNEIELYLASIEQVCWDLEWNYIRMCSRVASLDVFIMLSSRCLEVLQKFFVKFNPRGLKEPWKIQTYSDGENIWLL